MFRAGRDCGGTIHGVLGETRVFARATIEPPRLRKLILPGLAGRHRGLDRRRCALDRRTLDGPEPARHWIIATFACVFGFCRAG
jgi:hypothetical protein